MKVEQVLGYNFEYEVVTIETVYGSMMSKTVDYFVNVYRMGVFLFHVDYSKAFDYRPGKEEDVENLFLMEFTKHIAYAFTRKRFECDKAILIAQAACVYVKEKRKLVRDMEKSYANRQQAEQPKQQSNKRVFNKPYIVYGFGEYQGKKVPKLWEFDDKAKAIDHAISLTDSPSLRFGIVMSKKQYECPGFMNDMYNRAKRNGGITSFVEPVNIVQANKLHVDVKYR